MYVYSDPERENETHALPDVEVWEDFITIIRSRCGEFEVARDSENGSGFCPSCARAACVFDLSTDPDESGMVETDRKGWFYWSCFPGCLPDGDPFGPFATEDEAIANARSSYAE